MKPPEKTTFAEKKMASPSATLYLSRRLDAYALLERACRERWGMESLPSIEIAPGGKPRFSAFPRCHFSLSHSGPWALCGVFEEELGVDVEMIRPRRAGLPKRVFREEMPWEEFYRRWTAMEAYGKLTGRGIGALVGQPLELGEDVTLFQRRVENVWVSLCAPGGCRVELIRL